MLGGGEGTGRFHGTRSALVSKTSTSTSPVSAPAPVTPPATPPPTAPVSSGGSNSQVWFQVSSESNSIQLAHPIGKTYRFETPTAHRPDPPFPPLLRHRTD